MWTEVAKNDQDSLVDRWLRDQIKPDTWDKVDQVFPQGGKCLPQQKWVRMIEDTKSVVPIRYQQYGIQVKLAADKQDKTRATFGTLPKTYPILWVCCAHRNCMAVYDVTNSNDTQRNIHLAEHHKLGVKAGHSHAALHGARVSTLAERNATAASRHMSTARLAQLRVARYFIKAMRPFSDCEEASYREQASPDWVACKRDTMRGTIGECFLVAAQHVKLAITSVAKRSVLAFVHLNADLWTTKVSHQKFLGVRIFWKTGPDLKTALLAVTLYAPPKVQDKAASEWLLEYVLAVLK